MPGQISVGDLGQNYSGGNRASSRMGTAVLLRKGYSGGLINGMKKNRLYMRAERQVPLRLF